ncbi:transporter [Pseudomonas sp. NA-150]|uniref:transporter n=1 Tax=Pseudomonas sp. NA-150 TaxID=3367525 RepID=UPI0037CCA606
MSILSYLLLAAAIVLEVVGQLCFKHGLAKIPQDDSGDGPLAFWGAVLGNPWIGLGVATYTLEFAVWLAVLTLAPLSLAFPVLSLSYCGVVFASRFILGEKVGLRTILAMGLIAIGVAIVSV